jgi:Flp pilus assembly secretin CpaC
VELDFGATRRFKVFQLQRVSIGDASIADVGTAGSDTVSVTGAGLGTTTLIVWTELKRRVVTVQVRGPVMLKPNAEIVLKPGIQRVIDVPNVSRVAVGNTDIVDVQTIGDSELLMIGAATGRTQVIVWKTDGTGLGFTVNVTRPDPVPGVVNLRLRPDESHVLEMKGIERCSGSNDQVATVSCGSGTLEIEAHSKGQLTVRAWRRDGVRSLFAVQVD